MKQYAISENSCLAKIDTMLLGNKYLCDKNILLWDKAVIFEFLLQNLRTAGIH